MSKISYNRKRGASFRFSDKERRRLKGVGDAGSEEQALADAENPPLTKQQLDRMAPAREVLSEQSSRGEEEGRPG